MDPLSDRERMISQLQTWGELHDRKRVVYDDPDTDVDTFAEWVRNMSALQSAAAPDDR